MTYKQISNVFYLWPIVMIAQGWENLKIWKEITNCRAHIANDANDQFCGELFYRNMRRAISEKWKRFINKGLLATWGRKFCKHIYILARNTTNYNLVN